MPQPRKKRQSQLDITVPKTSQFLKAARQKRGLTQAELAEKIGLTREAIAAYESGRVRLIDDVIVRFSLALNVSTDELLGLQSHDGDPLPSLRLMKRLQKIERLPLAQQKALLKNIDMFLKASETE